MSARLTPARACASPSTTGRRQTSHTNAKLAQRALRLTMHASGADEAAARAALAACGASVKVAIVMLVRGEGATQAQARLAAAEGSVRAALN